MGSSSSKIAHDFFPFVRIYEDGRVKRLLKYKPVPPTDNPKTGVRSKDVVISPETNLWARLYLPRTDEDDGGRKFPLLIFIHGGAFCLESASSANYDRYLHSLTAEANVVAVSVEYRLAPEHKVPACYDDSWSVIEWAWSHAKDDDDDAESRTEEPWLKNHADFSRVFFAGDSAGATIAHNMMVRASDGENLNPKPVGMILLHPFFGNHEKNTFWEYICPDTTGPEDPLFNPAAHPGLLSKLVCSKVLVAIAEWDFIRESGNTYYEALKNSEWRGELLELEYSKKRTHVFFLGKRKCEQARSLMKKIVSFINQP